VTERNHIADASDLTLRRLITEGDRADPMSDFAAFDKIAWARRARDELTRRAAPPLPPITGGSK
jgi:hypothetical protein